ncbi:MAG: class I SAM-dependent methyltransferase [Sulfuricellaceae bacterium]|nr:class I SAM-dependent methyltransferase [Sulfuricellaceae bacterium]
MIKKIESCRICGNTHLEPVLDLGEQTLTGVFPSDRNLSITSGPLRLVKCMGGDEVCGLLQLEHSYDHVEMYGENYGYRSGLNQCMVRHLHDKVAGILSRVTLDANSLVVDIGSNDSTTLQAYPNNGCTLLGIDPTGIKLKEYYPPHIQLIPDFFTADKLHERFPGRKARVVTSFSMFYDLEAPLQFMREVASILDDSGIWLFEQSYLPLMLERNAYDTVCHEHLEYYALRQIKWMADRAALKILDVEFNDTNGGSFSITVAKQSAPYEVEPRLDALLNHERDLGLDGLEPYRAFAERVANNRQELVGFVRNALAEGKRIAVLGASTKGNVVLQYCGLTEHDIFAVGEVNPDKYGHFTPGSLIPIVPESTLLDEEPDYLLVLPWHFRGFFESKYKLKHARLVFPLPMLEVVDAV